MNATVAIHDLARLGQDGRARLLVRAEDDLEPLYDPVRKIIAAVAADGDEALARFGREFDRADIDADRLLVSDAEFAQARQAIAPELVATLEFAADNIRAFHEVGVGERQWSREMLPGMHVGERVTPVRSAACYTPRGKGCFPSVTLMTVIPAVVAGVPEVVVLTPPGPDGGVDPGTLVAARIAGAHRVVKAGGAQAVAAAAYGTASVPRCAKFEGPGSPWLAAARRLLAGRIDSRLPAGPSESIVLADGTADAHLCALDLLVESEHGADSSVFLVTWDRGLAGRVAAAVPPLWERMGETCRRHSQAVLGGGHGGIVVTADAAAAHAFVNDYAPEHLQIMSTAPEAHLEHVTEASEILLGQDLPGSIANYLLGPNCVLPTAGAARTHSPLGVDDFRKRCTVARLDRRGYDALAPHTRRFATYEGFDAHANAVSDLRHKPASS